MYNGREPNGWLVAIRAGPLRCSYGIVSTLPTMVDHRISKPKHHGMSTGRETLMERRHVNHPLPFLTKIDSASFDRAIKRKGKIARDELGQKCTCRTRFVFRVKRGVQVWNKLNCPWGSKLTFNNFGENAFFGVEQGHVHEHGISEDQYTRTR
jgi:hypothetical protein